MKFISQSQYFFLVLSFLIGISGIFFFTSLHEKKKDTLSFLMEKEEASFLADFITPSIKEYNGPISESLYTCIDGYNEKEVENIFSHRGIQIENGEITVDYNEEAEFPQSREEIRNELMPVFGHAVKYGQINWTWDSETKKYTFETYPGQEGLWFCYFRKETSFFIDFFNITHEKQIDPLPKVSDLKAQYSEANEVTIIWNYDYLSLYHQFEAKDLTFEMEYREVGLDTWVKVKRGNEGYTSEYIAVRENQSDESLTSLLPNKEYDIRVRAKSNADFWYSDGDYRTIRISTFETDHNIIIPQFVKKGNPSTIAIKKDKFSFWGHIIQGTKNNGWIYVKDKNQNIVQEISIIFSDEDRKGIGDCSAETPEGCETEEPITRTFSLAQSGIYEIQACYGETKETCTEYGNPIEIEVFDIQCQELFEGHNKPDADRINIIFFGSRYDSISTFLETVKESLRWDGTPAIIKYFDEKEQKDVISNLGWGFFATEPMKSHKEKFNLWYADSQLTSSLDTYYSFGEIDNFCGLEYEHPVVYANRSFLGQRGNSRSNAGLPRFGEGGEKGDPDMFFQSSSHNYMPQKNISWGMDYALFVHESGHGIFGLHDEYTEPGQTEPLTDLPNCAASLEEAEQAWGNLIGSVDPFYYTVVNEMKKYGIDFITSYDEAEDGNLIEKTVERYPMSDYITQYFKGGCYVEYGDERVIKPTKESVMSSNYPIWGSVNRKQVQKVLDMFSGE